MPPDRDKNHKKIALSRQVLRDILVPLSLLRAPDAFGPNHTQDCLRGDLVVENGHPIRLDPASQSNTPRMLVPALFEAHCHLDKCHSIDRLAQVGGDLSVALEAQIKDKFHWTHEDLRSRMARGLSELVASGCYAVRSHIDWGDTNAPPLAWYVLAELAQDHPEVVLQGAALAGIPQIADPSFCLEVSKTISAQKGTALGTFILHHDRAVVEKGLANAFAAADRFGLALDFHVDEGLGAYNGLELICDAALKTGFQGPILCGHAVSLADRKGADLSRLLDKLLRAKITICALPTTNLYLQGRRNGTPDRRGLTRLRELDAAGIPIAVGSDNVADAFCPMGQHDPRAALHLAALAAHLDPPMGTWLPAITLNPARAMGLAAPYIEDTPVQHLRLCAAASAADLVSTRAPLVPLLHHLEVEPQ